MSLWDDLWNSLWGVLATPFAAADNALLGYVPSAIEYTPNLGTSAVQTVWTLVYVVFLGSLGIAVAGIGLLYILTPVVEKKVRLKFLWTKLAFALVLGGSSILIGNFTINLANQLTQGLLSGVSVSVFGQSYWGNSVNALGPGAFIVYLIALIFIVMVLIENGVRILMIFFAGAILPWGFLLWSFPTTQAYGTKILKMFFEWTFVSVFMAIVLAITFLILGGNGTGNDILDAFLFLGGLGLVAAMPKVMTETGSAVSDVGMAALGGVGGAQGGMMGGLGGAAGGPAGMAAGMAGKMGNVASKVGGAAGGGGKGGGGAMAALGRAGWMMAYNPIGGAGAIGGMVAGGLAKGAGRALHRGVRGATGALRRHGAVKSATQGGMSLGDARAIASGKFSPSGQKGGTLSPPSGGVVGKETPRGKGYLAMEKTLQGSRGQGLYQAGVTAHGHAERTRARVHQLGERIRHENGPAYQALRERVSGSRSPSRALTRNRRTA